jgi:CRP-like cAMP-binding protein
MSTPLSEDQYDWAKAVLRRVPLFGDLRDPEMDALVKIVLRATYRAGEELFRQSDMEDTLYVIASGRIALFHVDAAGVEQFVGMREAGPQGWLGETSVLLGEPRDVTALAQEAAETLLIKRKSLRELMDANPRLRAQLKPQPETAQRVALMAEHHDWLTEGELIVRVVHRHPWALIRQTVLTIWVLIAINLCALLAATAFDFEIIFIISAASAIVIFIGLSIYVYLNYKNDFYVVTNKRVLHVDQVPLGRQRFEEAPLGAIQEIQFERNTIWASLMDFGDLAVETFTGIVAMTTISHPEDVKALIFRQIETVQARSRAAVRKAIRDELETRVGQKEPSPPQPPAAPEGPATPSWQAIARGGARYFLPRSREVVGDTVVYRKHWIVLIRSVFWSALFLALTLIAMGLWLDPTSFLGGLLPDSVWPAWAVLIMAGMIWFLWVYEDYRNDLYIVTTTRIIDLRRTPFLLQETRRESGLDKIVQQDVNVPTALARLLQFGTVVIKVPSGDFQFEYVARPTEVAREISKRIDQFKRRQAEEEARTRRTELSDWFATYDQIKSGYQAPVSESESGE